MENIKDFNQFNESNGKSFMDKIKEFAIEIKDIIKDCKIDNKEFYKNELWNIKSLKDLLKIKINKDTYNRLSELYKNNKERIDKAYNKVFGKDKVNEEIAYFIIIIYLLLIVSGFIVGTLLIINNDNDDDLGEDDDDLDDDL